ncbi:MAG TPA: amidohydrolase family protein [Chthonomonadales bacterium]|nr:amidohydrolase family protein [Chthonomonadales bacterium]
MTGKKLIWLTVISIMALPISIQHASAQASLPPEVVRWADLVLYNGKILTADRNFTITEAVAVRDGKFLAVGKNDKILSLAGPNTRRIDLQGKTVTPGIMDLHGGPGGLGRYWESKWLPGEGRWRTKDEAIAGLKKLQARAKPGDIIVIPRTSLSVPVDATTGGRAGNFCDIFTRTELDALVPNNAIYFAAAVNDAIMATNTKGAELAKKFLPKGVDSVFIKEGNICVASGADLDGILTPGTQACNDVAHWAEPPDHLLDYYRDSVRRFNQAGITLGKQHMAPPSFNGLRALWERGELNMRFRMPAMLIPQISGHTVELPAGENAEAFFRRWGNLSHIGDNMLRIVGMRIPAVGGNVMGGDAWMMDPKIRPYPDRWGNPSPYGGRIQEQAAVERGERNTFRGRDVLIQAIRFGWDVSADHTVGDRAFHEVLKAVEEAKQDMVVKNRPMQRITTNHTPMAKPDDIELAAKLGVWSSISSGHAIGGANNADLEAGLIYQGIERMTAWFPIKSFIKAGLKPSLEGTMWESTGMEGRGIRGAFFWIGKAITRRDEKYRRVWNPAQALTREEALWAATLWSAEQLAEEKDLGSIEPEKEADLVILDKDYMAVPPEEIESINVLLTMVGGKVVWEAPSQSQ